MTGRSGAGTGMQAAPPPLLRDIELAFIRIHVLHHAAEGQVFGLWMREELAAHGYDVSVGTLYPMLHQLESDGYLASTQRREGGRRRRYYEATPAGQALLAEVRVRLAELVGEVRPAGAGGAAGGQHAAAAARGPGGKPCG